MISIIGLVVGQINDELFYVWCKETFLHYDGILIANPCNPVAVGYWILMHFTPGEAACYFPVIPTFFTPRFESFEYEVIPNVLATKVEGKSILIRLEEQLTESQHDLVHPVLGLIRNNLNIQFPAGTYCLTIRRTSFDNPGSVWALEKVEALQVGIVAGQDESHWFVWCKDRPVGEDISILKSTSPSELSRGTWVKMILPIEKMSEHFLVCEEYLPIPQYYSTGLLSDGRDTLIMKLTVRILRKVVEENIIHPFVGWIINETITFENPGIYAITLYRTKLIEDPADQLTIRSVWHLKHCEYLEPVNADSTLFQPFDVLSYYYPQVPLDGYLKEAVVTKIKTGYNAEGKPYDKVFVWLPEKKKDGRSHLDISVDDYGLTPGKVFIASFTEDKNGKWSSWGPLYQINHKYETLSNETENGHDFKIKVDNLQPRDNAHFNFKWIRHEDFGDIIDNKKELKMEDSPECRLYIRRAKIEESENFQWVVVRKIFGV